jgi:hypothetical protein
MQGQIDILKERPIPIKDFAAEVPGRDGKPIHWITLGQWCRRGVRGIVLESVVVGNQRCVTRESYARFVEAVTRAANGESPQLAVGGRTRPELNRAVRESVDKLTAAGA